MRNPFKKKDTSIDIDVLLSALIYETDALRKVIKSLREDVDNLTDFVEEHLD